PVRASLHLLARPPLPSLLLPYTTLFRSGVGGGLYLQVPARSQVRLPGDAMKLSGWGRWPVADARIVGMDQLANGDWPCPAIARGDRKSTRLNSSHVKISYAVFCLKQKTP